MTQNVLLIWLDPDIDDNNDGCQDNIAHFRAAINNIDTFTDSEECIQFLDDMAAEKACMIISGSLGQEIVPRIHNLTQVDSIFIFCSNEKYHEEWAKDWLKIKGVFNEMQPLCEAVKHAAQQCDQNAMSIKIMGSGDTPTHKADCQLDPSFIPLISTNNTLISLFNIVEQRSTVMANNSKMLKKLPSSMITILLSGGIRATLFIRNARSCTSDDGCR